jgi:hypothetical protein
VQKFSTKKKKKKFWKLGVWNFPGQVVYLWEPPVIMFHWKPSCIPDRLDIYENHLENHRVSCSTENHIALWTGYIYIYISLSMRTTLRTSGYLVPLKTILHSGQVIYISAVRTTLRTSGYRVPLKTILHSQHNKQ